jgi:hypothetical protein
MKGGRDCSARVMGECSIDVKSYTQTHFVYLIDYRHIQSKNHDEVGYFGMNGGVRVGIDVVCLRFQSVDRQPDQLPLTYVEFVHCPIRPTSILITFVIQFFCDPPFGS